MTSRPLILASTSRYRAAQLERLGIAFEAIAPRYEEDPDLDPDPSLLVVAHAEGKARSLETVRPEAIVVGGDQVAAIDGTILTKPGGFEAARDQLRRLAGRSHELHTRESTRQVVDPSTIEAGRAVIDQIYIDPAIREYIVDLVNATRYPAKVDTGLKPLLRAGASPRASINLILACRAKAFMEGRSFVTPQDVKFLARDILRHRVLLSYEAEAEDLSADMIIERILSKVPVP